MTVDLRAALAALVAGGEVPRQLRNVIGASWQRSVDAGLRPDHVDVPFDREHGGDEPLIRAARPVLDQLAVDLGGTAMGIVLANDRGRLIDRRVADGNLSAALDRVQLAPGFVHAEDRVGTNGVGTALAQRSPIAVDGDEHFADSFTTTACAAAPITDPRSGRILGVVDLTSLAGDASELMLPLAARAAREIEHRLVDADGVSERLMLQRFLQERRWAKGPLVLVTPRTMITNAAAARLIKADDEPVLRDWATLPLGGNHTDPALVVLSGGTVVSVRWEPLLDGGARVGALLRLKPTKSPDAPHTRDGHPTFGWASLTATERTVVELVAAGLTNREAAKQLYLSHHTVGFHLRSIFCKLDVTSRVELTRLAIEHDTTADPSPGDLVAISAGV